jgi:hypothetical protein
MREFFRSWQRCVGFGLLLVGLALTGLWIHSWAVCDVMLIPVGQRQSYLISLDGTVYWWGATIDKPRWYADSIGDPFTKIREQLDEERRVIQQIKGARLTEWRIPYWSVAIPLVLVTALLILWPQRSNQCGNRLS